VSDAEGLGAVAATGDTLATLKALRDRLATDLDSTTSKRDLASLSRLLVDVLSDIDAIEKSQPEQKGTARDEVARKRADRTAASKTPRRSASRR